MTHTFMAASHHDLLVLLVQVSVLLFTARVMGELAQRIGQPTVVGEILAGIVLGPSMLSKAFPDLSIWIVPHTDVQSHLLELVSLIGVMFLLLVTGMETDLTLIRRQARSAMNVALGGLFLPLLMGFGLGLFLPDQLLPDPGSRLVFAMFVAIATAISALPVIAKVLMDLKLTRRDIAQTVIAAAMIDDTIGWILLSVVISLASGDMITPGSVGQSVFKVLSFLVLSLTVGRWCISRLLGYVQNHVQMPDKVLSFAVLLMFVWGAIGHALGIEALLGAFVVGIVLGRIPQMNPDVIQKLESIAMGIFAPIFFAVAGLKVHIVRLLIHPSLLIMTLIVIAVAIFCKMVGVYLGARFVGKNDHWTSVFYGASLNARGSMGVIVANIGFSYHILSQEMFSIIVVMAIVTSLMSPVVMRWAVRHIVQKPEELARLHRETLMKESLLANVHRVLLPTRLRTGDIPAELLETRLMQRMDAASGIALTMLTITDAGNYQASVDYLNRLAERFPIKNITKKVMVGEDIGNLILDEAKMDYDLMILGTPEERSKDDVLFTPLLDYLIHMSPCPTMLIQEQGLLNNTMPKNILVPSNGHQSARHAAEVAFALAAGQNAEVTILHVVEIKRSDNWLDAEGSLAVRQRKIARESVEKLCELGDLQDVIALPRVKIGTESEQVILQTANTNHVDLIVLGSNTGIASERLHLGSKVERILSNAPCPVIILNTSSG